MDNDWSERLILVGVIVVVWSMWYATIEAVTRAAPVVVTIVPERMEYTLHRPTMCQHLYNTGTDEWSKCLGVEEK